MDCLIARGSTVFVRSDFDPSGLRVGRDRCHRDWNASIQRSNNIGFNAISSRGASLLLLGRVQQRSSEAVMRLGVLNMAQHRISLLRGGF